MTESSRLHDLRRSWRYWLWGGEALAVPVGSTHEDVAEEVFDSSLPEGRSAQSLLLEHGAVKQWDLHFMSGSKTREALKSIQDQLWCMVQEEKLGLERPVMLSLGDSYELTTLHDVLSAHQMRDLLPAAAPFSPASVRQNASGTESLATKLCPKGQCPEIGTEQGKVVRQGVSRYVADYGGGRSSARYVYAERGEPVAVLQVVTSPELPGEGLVAAVYTAPAHRRRGLATMLLRLARQDYTAVHPAPATHRSELGEAWVAKTFERNPGYLNAVKKDMAAAYGEATTENPWESGYLLADGSWLKMGHGTRGDDHRVVAGYVRGKAGKEAYSGSRWNALVKWCQVTGSIRWMPENCSFELFTAPTREQIGEMWRMARSCPDLIVEQQRGSQDVSRTFEPVERDAMVEWVREFWR